MSLLSSLIAMSNQVMGSSMSLDFFLIQDLSHSYENDLPFLKTQIPEVVTYLSTEYPDSNFGLGSFVDKPFAEFGYLESEDYCYQLHVPLMNIRPESVEIDGKSVVRGVLHNDQGDHVLAEVLDELDTYSGRDWKENQLGALLHAIKSAGTNWSREQHRVPLIALATDAGYHVEGDGVHANLVSNPDAYAGPASEWCLSADYPSVADIKTAVDETGSKLLFLVTSEMVGYYQKLLNQIGPDSGIVVQLDERSEFIASAIKNGMSQLDFGASGHGFGKAAASQMKDLVAIEEYDIANEALLNIEGAVDVEKRKPKLVVEPKAVLPANKTPNPNSIMACGEDVVFEIVLAQDASDSFENDMAAVSKKVPESFRRIQESYPGSRFGLTAYIDKPIEPFGYDESGDYCASMRVGLTDDVSEVKESLEKLIIRSGNDYEEAQLHALMHSAYTKKAEWTTAVKNEEGKRVIRVVALATDALYHEAGDSSLNPNNGDQVLDCTGEDYPSVEQVSNAFRKQRIFPLFLTTGDIKEDYESLLIRLGLNGDVQVIDEVSGNIDEAIISGLEAICSYDSVSSVHDLHEDRDKEADDLIINLGQRPKFISVVTKK